MRNIEEWRESKYMLKKGTLIGSRNKKHLSVGSRLVADLVANHYQLALGKYARGRLLDLGCGYVPLYGAYKEYVSENVCVDWGNTQHKNNLLDIECDLNEELPFESKCFDTVILSDVLEHIFCPERLLKEIHRVLRNEGVLILNTPFIYWIHEAPYDYYRYTEFAYRAFADKIGFRVLDLDTIGGRLECFGDLLCKCCIHIPLVGGVFSEAVRILICILRKLRLGGRGG